MSTSIAIFATLLILLGTPMVMLRVSRVRVVTKRKR